MGEDLQLATMAYSDPSVLPFVLNHRYGMGGKSISTHCMNDPALLRSEYSLWGGGRGGTDEKSEQGREMDRGNTATNKAVHGQQEQVEG